jgi:oxygen-independent coproporphyrinogen-3 oxidase
MDFGVYIHIPYCVQKCTYCDFATYEQSQILAPERYVDLVRQELRAKAPTLEKRSLYSIYFGGGTPSLIPATLLVSLIDELSRHGFPLQSGAEGTIEINPGTLTDEKIETYMAAGLNRFSIGVQTFDENILRAVKREHSADDTRRTLLQVKRYPLRLSLDLLFGLPGQTPSSVRQDVWRLLEYDPEHISTYCLTVPEQHPLARTRPPEDMQIEMFDVIRDELREAGYDRYEISSFAKPGFVARHNHLYWTGQEYWGLGLSAHSFLNRGDWGLRFWNRSSIQDYEKYARDLTANHDSAADILSGLSLHQFENLKMYETLTDFCHVSLRMMRGLSRAELMKKFPMEAVREVESRLALLIERKAIEHDGNYWRLSYEGLLASNLVFEHLTFLKADFGARN